MIVYLYLQTLHKELLEKEALIEDIRNKSQELMKTKKGVPGMDRVQQQFAELGNCFFLMSFLFISFYKCMFSISLHQHAVSVKGKIKV